MKYNIHTISPHLPFADTLARWVLDKWGGEPLVLARALILLPSRRTAQTLREAFLRVGKGRPLLLPRIEPLGDADEDALLASPFASLLPLERPSETFPFRRHFLLARLVHKRDGRMDQALKLALPLAKLLDECEREEVALEGLVHIVPDAFAAHWQETVEFLKILSAHWPEIAREEGLTSPGLYQAQVLKALAAHWESSPPDVPVIAAGTTGSIPATAELLSAICRLPHGHIVLPGLDMQADEDYLEHVSEGHPQWGMAQLLKKLGCPREEVQQIGEPANARARLMSEVMRPAEVSEAWRGVEAGPDALRGLSYIACDNVQEEADVIALLLREALEVPGRTAALVTHNRALATRVAAIMRRFGVTIDDSAGIPLMGTPLVAFLRLLLEAASEALAPLPLLSLLKHPLAHVGMERIDCLEAAREVELSALRGLRVGNDIEGIRQKLLKAKQATDRVHLLMDTLEKAFAPLLALLAQKEASLLELLDAHLACAGALGGDEMWDGAEGEPVAQFFREVRAACETDGLMIEADSYPSVFEELLAGRVYRPQYGMHPRLKILSPMEARMQSFDRVILGGLNEGSWPPAPASDPWFSRPMRASLGLPLPERRLGLAAHDFFMLACSADVVLTRAAKEDGVPTIESRWAVKLSMLAKELPGQGERWTAWAQALDAPAAVLPITPPAPAPPLAARPRKISVTQVETWMRDPYAVYASKILRLRALEAIARDPDNSDFGNAAHAALERFVKDFPTALPSVALSELLRCGRQAFSEFFEGTGLEALWWPRFSRIAEWIIEQEEERRANLRRVTSEVKGECRFGDFLLYGRADRIEEGKNGSISIIDYKTGGLPLDRDIENGLASQLILLALIAREGGMNDVVVGPLSLEHWKLQGREDAGKIKPVNAAKIENYISEAKEGLLRRIARFDDPAFPYRSVPVPARASKYSDYDHLARVKEWS